MDTTSTLSEQFLTAGLLSPRLVHSHPSHVSARAADPSINGDLYRLSRMLGHASISTTHLYLRSMGIEAIGEGHDRLTPLNLTHAAALHTR